ncbi:MAG: thiaminase II [Gordonia sp. (in: high G+C Gram-positive bacteria)]
MVYCRCRIPFGGLLNTAPASTAELRESVGPLWAELVAEPFCRAIADGSLPLTSFRFYVSQNLIYLQDYARMLAVGASRARNGAELEQFTDALDNIVKVEIPQNERLLARVEALVGVRNRADLTPGPATVAYTSWLTSIAARGNADDIAAALLPCAWSYGDIACGLTVVTSTERLYGEWIEFFASEDYAHVVKNLRAAFDARLAIMTADARTKAAQTFLFGCRLERQFWHQGLMCTQWPDLGEV